VFEEFDDFLAGLGLHLDEDLLGAILREVAEEVGGGVGIHFLDDVGGASRVEGFNDGFLNAGLDFFESLGGYIFIEGTEDGFTFIGSEVFDDVSDVGGMESGQAIVRNLEFDAARGVGFDEIDITPGDVAGRDSLEQHVQSGAGSESAKKAADGAPDADVDGLDTQDGVSVSGFDHGVDLEVNVVDADDFTAVNVDDLLIEEIALEEEQAFGAVGSGPVRGVGGSVNVGVDCGDGGEGKNAVAGFGFDDEGGDAIAVFLRSEGDFAHMSGGRAGRVVDGGAEKLGKRQRGHPG
jgi:hypothetical protein